MIRCGVQDPGELSGDDPHRRVVIIMTNIEKSIVKSIELACLARARSEGLLDDEEFMNLTVKIKKKYRLTDDE